MLYNYKLVCTVYTCYTELNAFSSQYGIYDHLSSSVAVYQSILDNHNFAFLRPPGVYFETKILPCLEFEQPTKTDDLPSDWARELSSLISIANAALIGWGKAINSSRYDLGFVFMLRKIFVTGRLNLWRTSGLSFID